TRLVSDWSSDVCSSDLMLGNRWEFIPTDLAAVSLGAIPFSIYQTYAPEQIEYLLSDAESKVVITEQAYLDNVNQARKGVSTLERSEERRVGEERRCRGG